jgi:hypothetical protein
LDLALGRATRPRSSPHIHSHAAQAPDARAAQVPKESKRAQPEERRQASPERPPHSPGVLARCGRLLLTPRRPVHGPTTGRGRRAGFSVKTGSDQGWSMPFPPAGGQDLRQNHAKTLLSTKPQCEGTGRGGGRAHKSGADQGQKQPADA